MRGSSERVFYLFFLFLLLKLLKSGTAPIQLQIGYSNTQTLITNTCMQTFFGRTPKQPVSKRPIMKFKKPNLASANTPATKTASFKTANIHNAYLLNYPTSKCPVLMYRDNTLETKTSKIQNAYIQNIQFQKGGPCQLYLTKLFGYKATIFFSSHIKN
jgi:hypothetical protein